MEEYDIDLDEFSDEIEPWVIEELKRMGYNHIAIGNGTPPSLDEAASLRVWKDVLPHVR